jgi:hypothetical protein
MIVRVPYREDLSSYLNPNYPYRYAHLRNFDEHGLILLFERVFELRVVEITTAGRSLDWTRIKYPLPIGNRALAKLARLIRRLFPPLGRTVSRRLFIPVEINVVVQKIAIASSS